MSQSKKKVDFDPNTMGLSYKFNKMCIDNEVITTNTMGFNKMCIDNEVITTNKKEIQGCDKMVIRRNRDVNKLRRYRSEPYAATEVICKELIRAPPVTITTEGNNSPYPVKYLNFNNIK